MTNDSKTDVSTSSEIPAKRGQRLVETAEKVLIPIGLCLLFLLPHNDRYDGIIRLQALSDLLSHGERLHMHPSLVGPLFSTPLWLLGKVVGSSWWWAMRFNVVVLAVGLLCVHLLLKDRLPRGLVRKFILLIIAASMFACHVKFYYGEVFTAVLVMVGCLLIVLRGRIAGWVAVVVGVANTQATLVGLTALTARHIFANRRLRYALAIMAAVALIVLDTWFRVGRPFDTEYAFGVGPHTIMPYSGQETFSLPIFFGVLSLLFSFGKGLIWFAPGLLLLLLRPVRETLRKLRQETGADIPAVFALWVSFLAGILLVYSAFYAWHGGWFWGPRYLLFASAPATFALAVCVHRVDLPLRLNLLTLGVLSLSLWVGVNGVVYGVYGDSSLRELCRGRAVYIGYFEEPLCYYTPEFSDLWFPFVSHQVPDHGLGFAVYWLAVAAVIICPVFMRTADQLAVELRRFSRSHKDLRF